MPPDMVPAARYKVGRGRMVVIGGGMLVALVVVITLVAVVSRAVPLPCARGCTRPGTQVINAATYQNQRWGYTVPYDSSALAISSRDANGAQLTSNDGEGGIAFTATGGNDVAGANQNALNGLPSSNFQNLRQMGPVRGAEIGLVSGEGSAWSADYVDPTGSGATPVSVIVFSASRSNVTITVTAFGAASSDNADQPYGVGIGQELDFAVTYTQWKGQ